MCSSDLTNSPIWSLLETAYTPLRQHCGLYAIYSGETVVGMVRLDFTLHEGYYEFTNLLIDREHQRKHCAAEAIRQIIEVFRRDGRYPLLRIHVAPENAAAIRLYEKLGFTYAHNPEEQVFRVYEYPL